MRKCTQCNIIVRDDSQFCPLCRCVIDHDTAAVDTYPDVRLYVRRLKRLSNVCFFILLVVSAVLLYLNYTFYHGMLWSLIPVGAMCYLYLLLRYAILSRHGYRSKIMVISLTTILLVVLIDYVTGYHGWSVNFVFPSGIMTVDLIIVILMLLNKRNWQSYIIFQLGMILLSIVPLLLWHFDIITAPLLSLIAVAVSVFLFLGTLIIGDRRARVELWRRFHI